ncbi:REP-associated tyrosine transposase [Methylophilus aquaticus]|uniref:Transposase n=1 Tax=Methylophilus aquaticus TaxID=1971610 RepID=A0ABT9JVT4_9PROT|nr:transposase [Methylophilus aquaticus]MDP8568672.1 transposase [Methylophilus aquaticus]
MSRPVRIAFPGALYHVTARGDRREDIVEDDEDRRVFLQTLEKVIRQFNWLCYAWCLMDNHYHLLIQTPDGNLSKGMRQLNGVYTQASNRRHRRVGHLFQGRFKAILVDSDAYLLELSRYVVLNPVRAGMVETPAEWAWSSYSATVGLTAPTAWLALDDLLATFAEQRSLAQSRYAQFVAEGMQADSPWQQIKGQVFLGDEAFVQRMQECLTAEHRDDVQILFVQRRPLPPSLRQIQNETPDRNAAIRRAYATGAYSYQDIADYFEIHFTTVGRVVRQAM